MKLITEHIEDLEFVTEAAKGGGESLTIQGVFMQTECENRNRRIYRKASMLPVIEKFVTERVVTGRAVGELDHPPTPQINLDKVSHRITELRWSGNDILGKALVLDTPMGNIVKGLYKGGVKFGVSSRGMGNLVKEGTKTYVGPDYVLSTVDVVQDPSAPSAFVDGIMEGTEWVWNNGILEARQIEVYETEIKKTPASRLVETQAKVFADFLSKVKIAKL